MQIVDYFLDSLKSPHTKLQYDFHRQRYRKYNDSVGFVQTTPEKLTKNIVEYLSKMKSDGLSYSFRNTTLAAIKHDLTMKDIVLNWPKISKFLGEKTVDNEIRGYTHEEIGRMLQISSIQDKAIILTYASTGMRRSALIELKVKDFVYLPNHQIYKIEIYKKTNDKQICFTSVEAAQAIRVYIKDKSPEDYFHNVVAKSISEQLRVIVLKAGIGAKHDKLKKGEVVGQFRDEVSAVHSLRKFCITQMARAKVNTEIAKILTGHSIGVRSKYLDYSEDDLLEEYKKAIPFLTISKEEEFKAKTERLEAKNEQIVSMVDTRLQEKDAQLVKLQNQIKSMQESHADSMNEIATKVREEVEHETMELLDRKFKEMEKETVSLIKDFGKQLNEDHDLQITKPIQDLHEKTIRLKDKTEKLDKLLKRTTSEQSKKRIVK
jgi:integrase